MRKSTIALAGLTALLLALPAMAAGKAAAQKPASKAAPKTAKTAPKTAPATSTAATTETPESKLLDPKKPTATAPEVYRVQLDTWGWAAGSRWSVEWGGLG